MANNKRLKSIQKGWNVSVEKKAIPIEKVILWLRQIEKWKDFTWYDKVRAKRARSYLELALAEVYSMQYASPNEFPGYLKDEFNWAKGQ